jgi:hypothetical protein
MDWLAWFNVFEACLWVFCGGVCVAQGWPYPGRYRTPAIVAGVLFVMFSVSEVIEVQTGAWWIPWWLPIHKGLVIAGLIATCVVVVVRQKRQQEAMASRREAAATTNE